MTALHVAIERSLDATRIGAWSRQPLGEGVDAALFLAPIVGDAIALGDFARARSAIDLGALDAAGLPLVRRACGGPPIRVAAGQVYVALSLRAPDLLGGVSDPARLLNRHVRPLLRALTSIGGVPAASGGRDVITMRSAPIAWVGVRHRLATNACGLEAVVSLDTPFAIGPELDLAQGGIAPRFLGRPASTLSTLSATKVEPRRVLDAIADAYHEAAGGQRIDAPASTLEPLAVDRDEPPFDALVEEAIGLVGAAVEPSRIAIGGELMVSDDVLGPLGVALFRLGPDASDHDLGAAIDGTFDGRPLLHGVRKLTSFARVVRAAWATKTKTRS